MLIGSRQRIATFRSVPCLEIDGVPIDKVLQTKSLGVYLDENLSWNIQINELTKKIASGIGALKRVRSFVPHKLFRTYPPHPPQRRFEALSAWHRTIGDC